jgi:hypothetical protein
MVIGNNQALAEAVMYQPYGTMSDPLSMSTPEMKEMNIIQNSSATRSFRIFNEY